MGDVRKILVLTPDSGAQRALLAAAERVAADGLQVQLCGDLAGFERELVREAPPIALLDVDPDPAKLLSRLEPLVAAHPATRFVVLCSEFRPEIVLEAMRVGARHCLVKASIGEELHGVVQRLAQDAQGHGQRGRVLTVLSAGGGCGATTIAINLAEELGLLSEAPALLVDLDSSYGSVGTYLGLQSDYGIVDVLARRDPIDQELVRSTATVYSESLHALLSPASIDFDQPAAIPFENLEPALIACSRTYASTVVDAPRVPMAVAADLAKASSLTLLVFELAVVDLRTARSMISALVDRGVPRERILPVANRFEKRKSMLGVADVKEALGVDEVTCVSNDFEGAIRSINFGQPLAKTSPRSPMRKSVRDIALDLDRRYRSMAS